MLTTHGPSPKGSCAICDQQQVNTADVVEEWNWSREIQETLKGTIFLVPLIWMGPYIGPTAFVMMLYTLKKVNSVLMKQTGGRPRRGAGIE